MKPIVIALLLLSSQIEARLHQLRQLPDAERIKVTRELALDIRRLPPTPKKEALAEQLANLVTEGDPGHDTLQEVATTLAQALHEQPVASGYATLRSWFVTSTSGSRWTICNSPQPLRNWKPTTKADSTPISH